MKIKNIFKLSAIVIISILFLSGCEEKSVKEAPVTFGEFKKAQENYLNLKTIDYGNYLNGIALNRQNTIYAQQVSIIEKYMILSIISQTKESDRKRLENLKIEDLIDQYERENNVKAKRLPITTGFDVPLKFYLESSEIRQFADQTIPDDRIRIILKWVNENKNDPKIYNEMLNMSLEEIFVSYYLYQNIIAEKSKNNN